MGDMARLDYDELNATVRYVMFSAFAVQPGVLGDDRAAVVDETATFLKQHEDNGVVVRGLYDVAGMRADAEFMIWTPSGSRPCRPSTATSAGPPRWAGP